MVKPAIEELELSYGVYSGSGLEGNRTVLVESPYEGEVSWIQPSLYVHVRIRI